MTDETPSSSPSFFDVVLRQRACRQFSDQPVDEELIELCLRAATHAPSAENRQPWVFVVVQDPTARQAVGELIRQVWRHGARQHSEGRLPDALLREVELGAEGGIGAAPVIVVVCGDTQLGIESTLPSSIYPATQNLLLAATALGLGSAMTTLATLMADDLAALLRLPSELRPFAVVPLGWPARPLGRPRRLPVGERTHREVFGERW
jgi:nitroreductase